MENPFLPILERLDRLDTKLDKLFNQKAKVDTQPVTATNEPEFLTKKQVAKMLNCSCSTVDNYRRSGKLKPYYLGQKNSTVRFSKNEVLELIGGK